MNAWCDDHGRKRETFPPPNVVLGRAAERRSSSSRPPYIYDGYSSLLREDVRLRHAISTAQVEQLEADVRGASETSRAAADAHEAQMAEALASAKLIAEQARHSTPRADEQLGRCTRTATVLTTQRRQRGTFLMMRSVFRMCGLPHQTTTRGSKHGMLFRLRIRCLPQNNAERATVDRSSSPRQRLTSHDEDAAALAAARAKLDALAAEVRTDPHYGSRDLTTRVRPSI